MTGKKHWAGRATPTHSPNSKNALARYPHVKAVSLCRRVRPQAPHGRVTLCVGGTGSSATRGRRKERDGARRGQDGGRGSGTLRDAPGGQVRPRASPPRPSPSQPVSARTFTAPLKCIALIPLSGRAVRHPFILSSFLSFLFFIIVAHSRGRWRDRTGACACLPPVPAAPSRPAGATSASRQHQWLGRHNSRLGQNSLFRTVCGPKVFSLPSFSSLQITELVMGRRAG